MKINLRTVLFLAGVLLIVSNHRALAHTDVTAEQARNLIDSTNDLVVVDVREQYEYCDATGHIPGALNYPWNSGVLEARYEELPIDGPVLVVCRSGGRSDRAANFLDSKGFSMVYDMLGGMRAWIWETAPCKYGGGTGTADDPYQIATAEDLMLLGDSPEDYDKHFILTADIDLDPNLPGRKIFDKAVIAPDTNDTKDYFEGVSFTGAFDGKSHVISNLHIQGGDYLGYLGLFGQLDSGAMVSNLGLEAVNVNGTGDYVGGLVGQNDGSIARSYSTGTVSGDFQIGGLVGANGVGTVTECYSTSTVSGDASVGGLVGLNWEEITMSYSTGTVTGDAAVGGFVGLNVGIITASYSTSMVTGFVETGGLVGQNGVNIPTRERNGAVFNCYSMGTVTGDWAVGGLVGANRLGNVDMSYSTGVVTDTDPNGSPPPWFPDDPFDPIYKGAGGLVGGNISNLTSCFWDVETSGQSSSDDGTGLNTAKMQTASTFLDEGWDFVDETENGTDDIWTITEGLSYPRLWWEKYGGGTGEPNDPYLIYTAEHLNAMGAEPNDWDKQFKLMADIDLAGYAYDRAVIAPDTDGDGYSFPGTSFTGVFDGNGHVVSHLTITGRSYLGLFGQLGSGAEVKDLGVMDVNITGSYYAIGGLVGNNFHGSITTSYSTGTVTGYTYVGGLVGYNKYGDIATSYSTGTVCGTFSGNQKIGGLVGVNAGRTTTSYSTGPVSGQRVVGGLVGQTMGSIAMCYSTGMVSGDQNIGGLLGDRHPDYGIVTNCFWDVQTSGLVSSEGGIGKTTTKMQTTSTFLDAGWDYIDETDNGTDDIWWILEGRDYPRLAWELTE